MAIQWRRMKAEGYVESANVCTPNTDRPRFTVHPSQYGGWRGGEYVERHTIWVLEDAYGVGVAASNHATADDAKACAEARLRNEASGFYNRLRAEQTPE